MADDAIGKVDGDAKKPDEDDFWLSDPKYPEAVFKVVGFSALTGATVRLLLAGIPNVPQIASMVLGYAVGLWLYYLLLMYAMGAVADPYFQHRKVRSKKPLEGTRRSVFAWTMVVILTGVPAFLVWLNLNIPK